MELYEIIFMLVGVALSLGAISYFFLGNNIWFSTAEHVYLGGNVAIILSGNAQSLLNSGYKLVAAGHLSLLIPCIIGLLAFTRWTRFRWSARYATAVLSGIGVGLMIGLQVRSSILSMVTATVLDVVQGRPNWWSGLISLVAFISVIMYYLYSKRLSAPVREGSFKFLSRLGLYFLLLTGGYLYSNVFMVEGIDLLAGDFIMWFKRSIEEINLYMATHSAAVAFNVPTLAGLGAGNIALSTGAVAAVGICSYAVYRKQRQKA